MIGSAVALSLIGSAGAVGAQATTDIVWTPYDYDTARVRAIQAINDADFSKQDIASVLGLIRDLRDSEMNYRMSQVITSDDLMAYSGTAHASHETRVNDARQAFMTQRDSIWATITERLGASKADALRNLVEFRPAMVTTTTYYDSPRIRRIDEILTWWDNKNSGKTVVTTTTVTPEPTGFAHRDFSKTTFIGVAPLTHAELADLMEAKLIAMTGSDEAAWMLQGMSGDLDSSDIKFARERMLRVWD